MQKVKKEYLNLEDETGEGLQRVVHHEIKAERIEQQVLHLNLRNQQLDRHYINKKKYIHRRHH